MKKSKYQIAREKELAWVKERLTEKGYREFLAKAVSCTQAYFNNGGTLNWADFEKK
jgi:hypothetical protein